MAAQPLNTKRGEKGESGGGGTRHSLEKKEPWKGSFQPQSATRAQFVSRASSPASPRCYSYIQRRSVDKIAFWCIETHHNESRLLHALFSQPNQGILSYIPGEQASPAQLRKAVPTPNSS